MLDAAKARAWTSESSRRFRGANHLQQKTVASPFGTNPDHPVLHAASSSKFQKDITRQHSHGTGTISLAIKSPDSTLTRPWVAGGKNMTPGFLIFYSSGPAVQMSKQPCSTNASASFHSTNASDCVATLVW